VGQLLCSGLLSTGDDFAVWCSSLALSHALVDSPQQREKLLKVHLAITHGAKPIPLLDQCSSILHNVSPRGQLLGDMAFVHDLYRSLRICSFLV
jgi:hypothetical protein